jgi:hypothetical protein
MLVFVRVAQKSFERSVQCSFSGTTTFSIMTLSITTLSITTLSITTISIKGLFVTLSIKDIQQNKFDIILVGYNLAFKYGGEWQWQTL